MGTSGAFGSPSEVHIAEGACWKFVNTWAPAGAAAYEGNNGPTGGQPCTPLNNTKVFVRGAGPDGNGAIYHDAKLNSHNLFGPLTLEGPTTFYTKKRWGIGGPPNANTRPIDMGGYDLTLKGVQQFELGRPKTQFVNPGDINLVSGSILFESGSTVMADGSDELRDHAVHISPGASIQIYNAQSSFVLDYLPGAASTLSLGYDGGSTGTVGNRLVIGNAGVTVDSGGGKTMESREQRILGGVTGGILTFSGSKHVAATPLLLSGSATNVLDELVLQHGNLTIADTTTNVIGKLTVSNSDNKLGGLTFRNGELSQIGQMEFWAVTGRVSFIDAGRLEITNVVEYESWNAAVPKGATIYLIGGQGKRDQVSRLVFSGNTVVAGVQRPNALAGSFIRVSTGSEYDRGIVDVRNGAIVSNDFFIGDGSVTRLGAVYLSGANSAIVSQGTIKSMNWFGRGSSYAAFEMTDGYFQNGGYLTLGQSGRGFWTQRGGTIAYGTAPLKVGRESNCYAHVLQLGGTFKEGPGGVADIYLGFCDAIHQATGHTTLFTVDGRLGTAPTSTVGYVRGYITTNATWQGTAIVNINNGGTLRAAGIFLEAYNISWADYLKGPTAQAVMYVNFDGGTLVTTHGRRFFTCPSSESQDRTPSRVTVFAGGATVDTAGNNVTFDAPLLKPYGKGVKSVTLTDAETLAGGYPIGTRRIRIVDSSGAGQGADAVTDFNMETRTDGTAAIVASSGWGYGDGTVAQVEAVHSYDSVSNAIVVLEELATTGGFTKTGEGTLTLASSNTWGGVTRVEGGALAFTHAEGYPGGDLEVSIEAITNCPAPRVTAVALPFRPGAVLRVTDADLLDKNCCHGFQTVATMETPLATLPPVAYVDGDGESVLVPNAWTFRLANGGPALRSRP